MSGVATMKATGQAENVPATKGPYSSGVVAEEVVGSIRKVFSDPVWYRDRLMRLHIHDQTGGESVNRFRSIWLDNFMT